MSIGYAVPLFTIAIVLLLVASVKVLREYERAVVFQLGRFTRVNGPGLVVLIPWIQQIVRVYLRTVVMEVPRQDLSSRDNVSVEAATRDSREESRRKRRGHRRRNGTGIPALQ